MMGIGIIAMRNGNREWEQGTWNRELGDGERGTGKKNGERGTLGTLILYPKKCS